MITIPKPQRLTIQSVEHPVSGRETESSTFSPPPFPTIIPMWSDEDDSLDHVHVPDPSPPRIITVTLPAGSLDNKEGKNDGEELKWTENAQRPHTPQPQSERTSGFTSPTTTRENYAQGIYSGMQGSLGKAASSIDDHTHNSAYIEGANDPSTARNSNLMSRYSESGDRFVTELPTMPPTFTPSTVIQSSDIFGMNSGYPIYQWNQDSYVYPNSKYHLHNPFMVGVAYNSRPGNAAVSSFTEAERGNSNPVQKNTNHDQYTGHRTTYKPVRGGFVETATGPFGTEHSSHGFPKIAGEMRPTGEMYGGERQTGWQTINY